MVITNNYNLPQTFYDYVKTHSGRHVPKGVISVTQLLKSPKSIILEDRYIDSDEIVMDCSQASYTLFGSLCHKLLEEESLNTENCFREETFRTTVDGFEVQGTADSYNLQTQTLLDWKTASVWKVINKDYDAYHQQLCIYAWLMKKSGLPVKHAKLCFYLKDHSLQQAKLSKDYPQVGIHCVDFEITEADMFAAELYVRQKIRDIKNNMDKPDDEIEPCTMEDRFQEPTKFACMKKGNKRAVKVFDSEFECDEMVKANNLYYKEERPSVPKKCLDYCPYNCKCNFYRDYIKQTENQNKEEAA